MGEIFELIMVICFGLSWPPSVYKSAKSCTAKRKNLFLEVFIWTGYVSAVIGKIVTQNPIHVLYLYILNIVMVSVDVCPYFRNRRLDALVSRKA